MGSTEEQDSNLIKVVPGATQPEAQKPIPLTEDLKQAGVDATHIIGNTVDELMNGEGGSSRDRVVSHNPINLVLERARRLKARFKKAA